MALVLGLLLGVGATLVWDACRVPVRPVRTSRSRREQAWRDDLVAAGWSRLGLGGLAGVCAGVALVVGTGMLVVTLALPVAVVFAVMAGMSPLVLVRSRARRRRLALREVWPDVVDHVASAVRAGLALPEALAQLGERGPVELREAFAAFAHDYRVSGRFAESLDLLKERLADPVADRLVEALRIAREVGGSDLGRLLRSLSQFLREDARTRAELEARQSWTVNAARLALVSPWIVLGLLCTRAEALATYRTPGGAVVLLLGGIVSVAAYALMRRLGRLPQEQRVLA